jgi:hypothetical protein
MRSRIEKHRSSLALGAAAVLALLLLLPARLAGEAESELGETVAVLIGAPVFSADGLKIGVVADVATDDAGAPERIRFTADSTLGAERQLELPLEAFSLLRGAVVVDLPAEAVLDLAQHPAERDSGN